MAQNRHNFTVEYLNGMPPAEPGKRYCVYDVRCPDLAVRVTDTGVKSFVLMRRFAGKIVRVTLGRYPTMTIDVARKAAIENLRIMNNGDNPNDEKRAYRRQQTLGQLFEEFMERYSKLHKKSWRYDAREIPMYLSHWFGRKIGDITKAEIQAWFENITREHGLYQANRSLERLRAMYNKAIEWGWDGQNPTNGIKKNREVKRDRFLTLDEVPRFIAAVNAEELMPRSYIWMLLYTGARKSNVLAMRWEEIDFTQRMWRIPDTKNGDPVNVPLVDRAMDLLREIPRVSEWVFPSPKNPDMHYSDPKKAWARVLERAGISNLHIHDIRRTLGSWQAIAGSSMQIIGKSLGHKSSQSTEIYARLSTEPVRVSMEKAIGFLDSAAAL